MADVEGMTESEMRALETRMARERARRANDEQRRASMLAEAGLARAEQRTADPLDVALAAARAKQTELKGKLAIAEQRRDERADAAAGIHLFGVKAEDRARTKVIEEERVAVEKRARESAGFQKNWIVERYEGAV